MRMQSLADGIQGAVRTSDGSSGGWALVMHGNMFPETLTAASTPRWSGTTDLQSFSDAALNEPGIFESEFCPENSAAVNPMADKWLGFALDHRLTLIGDSRATGFCGPSLKFELHAVSRNDLFY